MMSILRGKFSGTASPGRAAGARESMCAKTVIPHRVERGYSARLRRDTVGIHGFTLVELMIAIAVLAILVNLALPSFRELSIAKNVTESTNQLVTDLNLARSEAVRRGAVVKVSCKASNCSSSWSGGWTVTDSANKVLSNFEGVNANAGYAVGTNSAGGTGTAAAIAFSQLGNLAGNVSEFDLYICRPDSDSRKSTRITVLAAGVIKASKDTTTGPGNSCGS
jgi:type IV fimbrial biogenesis protein FimT